MERHIAQKEGVIVCRSTSVLARTEQKVEGDADDVADYFVGSGWMQIVGCIKNMQDDADWERFYPSRGRVRLLVSSKLSGDAEVDVTMGILARVFGPQKGESLAHRP